MDNEGRGKKKRKKMPQSYIITNNYITECSGTGSFFILHSLSLSSSFFFLNCIFYCVE